MKLFILLVSIFTIAGCALISHANAPKSAYQIYLTKDSCFIKDGERVVYRDHFDNKSQLDSIILADNL